MILDQLTIGDAKELVKLFGGIQQSNNNTIGALSIVVLQRSWNVIGYYSRINGRVLIKDPFIIRNWGTTKGIGQLALEGPASNTVLDKTTDINCHELSEVFSMPCEVKKWEKYYK